MYKVMSHIEEFLTEDKAIEKDFPNYLSRSTGFVDYFFGEELAATKGKLKYDTDITVTLSISPTDPQKRRISLLFLTPLSPRQVSISFYLDKLEYDEFRRDENCVIYFPKSAYREEDGVNVAIFDMNDSVRSILEVFYKEHLTPKPPVEAIS